MTAAFDPVAPGVWRVLAPNPGLMTGPGTNTYLVGEKRLAVIDPGPAMPAHLDALVAFAAARGASLDWILLTHAHPDHGSAVGALRRQTGARLAAWATPNPVYPLADLPAPDRVLGDGDQLALEGGELTALHTPGHASDHLCFHREADGLLFTGDMVVGQGTVVIAPPDGDLRAYLASLDRLAALAPRRLLPGHGEPIEDALGKIAAYRAHRLAREAQVLDALRAGDTSVGAIVARLYAAYDPRLHPVAAQQVTGHLLKLEAEGRAHEAEGRWRVGPADGPHSA